MCVFSPQPINVNEINTIKSEVYQCENVKEGINQVTCLQIFPKYKESQNFKLYLTLNDWLNVINMFAMQTCETVKKNLI